MTVKSLLIIFQLMIMLPVAFSAGGMTIADSLMTDTTFVLRGELSGSWQGRELKFAVTDPLRNRIHELVSSHGRFDMTVPMRGLMQEIYLYIDGTVTIPVCAGDTVNLTIGEDDMWLSADTPAANLDLQLALALHRKTRRRDMGISRAYNEYYTESERGTAVSYKSDSLYTDVALKIADYQQRCKVVVDTFIARNGSPRSEEYFRVSGYFKHLFYLGWHGGLEHVTVPGYLSQSRPSVIYSDYEDRWLMYPAYRHYALEYLSAAVRRAHGTFNVASGDEFLRGCQLRRAISPSPDLADLADLVNLRNLMKFSSPEHAGKYIKPVYDSSASPVFRREVMALAPEFEKTLPGKSAPPLVMTDAGGKRVTLDDFKGKYVYLDFWDFGCKPCIREFGVMPLFRRHFADVLDRVELVTVCGSHPDSRTFSNFVRKHGMDGLNLMIDSRRSDKCYQPGFYPFYVLLDPQGRIVEFNTARPSQILRESHDGEKSIFEKALCGDAAVE